MKILISESQLRHIILEEQLPCEKVVTYDMLNRAKNWWLNRLTNDPSIVSKILETKYGKSRLSQMDKNSVFKLIDNNLMF